ncbi:ER membrane protein complex subunit 7 [Colletotrichum chlorophyti]|uniref:ER membrane protein complex subunit 7 n=1 Tax=Colletotrichum chlorophyti TaxID=708187 RepID=A0A1Q8RPN0_9PEZI|nr:ER membrane protein complex subunit 7 [Colletotrichum chlorophyti]
MRLLPLLAHAATTLAASLTLSIPPSAALPNPYTLPPSTRASLTSLGSSFTAPLSVKNTFVFDNLTAPGSYLVDVHCATHAFAPLRLDVAADGTLSAWETYRGNDWDNKGEAYTLKEFAGDAKGFEVRVLGAKNYFVERSTFSVFTILKNPMILLGLVSMGIFLGMPYLVDNMDPEMRAEFEERQKSNPMNSILGGGAQPGANPMGNFDVAAFLAGSGKKDDSAPTATDSGSSPAGGSNGKKEKGVRR